MTTEQSLMLAGLSALMIGGVLLFLTYRRRHVSLRARREAERLRREEAAGIPPRPKDYHYSLSVNSQGLTVSNLREEKKQPVTLTWAEIVGATAFKRDLLTVDCICLFLARSDGTGVEVNEEMARWEGLVESLPLHLVGCRPYGDWFPQVAFPAFETNEIRVFERARSSG